MPSNEVHLGLIGIGAWGRNYIRTIDTISDAKLVVAASGGVRSDEFVPASCRVVTEWREIIAAPDIDGIIVASPPATHADILKATLTANIPTLIEKPVVRSVVEANEIRNLLSEKSSVIMVDHVHLFHPAFRALQNAALSLGPIRKITSAAGNLGPYRRDVPVIWDWAPHDLAMCFTLIPGKAKPIKATRTALKSIDGIQAETIELTVRLDGGCLAHIRLSNLEDKHRWFAVEFDSATLVYRDVGPNPLVRIERGESDFATGVPIFVESRPPLTCAVLEFIDAIKTKTIVTSGINLGLDVVDMIDGLERMLTTSSRQ